MRGRPSIRRAVVAVVGGPPVLRRREHGDELLLHGAQVEGKELRGVVLFARPSSCEARLIESEGERRRHAQASSQDKNN